MVDLSRHLVGHRGYPARYPENSLVSLQAAVRAGARFVEFDVQVTADGVPVLSHDPQLQRLDRQSVNLLEISMAQVEKTPTAAPVCRLSRVVEWLEQHPQVTAFVELKPESLERFGRKAVIDTVQRTVAPVTSRCVLISFDYLALAQVDRKAGHFVGWVLPVYESENMKLAEDLKPEFLICNHNKLPAEDIPLWPGPWQWMVYEVSSSPEIHALLKRGVSLIETNDMSLVSG